MTNFRKLFLVGLAALAATCALPVLASAQNIRQLPRSTATTGANDSALVTISDSAGTATLPRTRAISLRELFKRPAGTCAKPSFSFAVDSGLGLHRAGSNSMAACVGGGVAAMTWSNSTISLSLGIAGGGVDVTNVRLRSTNGTAAFPSQSFDNSNSLGLYRFGADTLGIAASGRLAGYVVDSAMHMQFGRAAKVAYGFVGGAGTGLYYGGSGNSGVRLAIGGIDIFSANNLPTLNVGTLGQADANLPFQANATTGQSRYFAINKNTSSYAALFGYDYAASGRTGASIRSMVSGEPIYFLTNASIISAQVIDSQVQAQAGRAGKPSFSFTANPTTGAYSEDDVFSIAAGGTRILQTYASGLILNTGNITTPAGTAGAPALTGNGVGGAGIYFVAGDTIAFSDGSARTLSIASSANTSLIGGAGSMNIQAGTGASRSMELQVTTSGSAIQSALSLASTSVNLRTNGSSLLFSNGTVTTLGVAGVNFVTNTNAGSDTTTLAMRLRATALTAASGTPNSVCIDATTKEILENAALTCTVSAARFKTNIRALAPALATQSVAKLRPSTFNYIAGGRAAIGLIADSVALVDERLVTRESCAVSTATCINGRVNAVNYEQVTILLLSEVKRLSKTVDSLATVLKQRP